MNRFAAILAILGLSCAACVPKLTNFSKGACVPTTITDYAPNGSQLLVLPMWLDTRMYHFHSSYVIPASAIGTPEAAVPPRKGMYLDSLVCGGPTTFVVGYLVVVDTGSVIWTEGQNQKVSNDSRALKPELKTLLTSSKVGPALRDLIQYGSTAIAVDLNRDERTVAMRFVNRIPDEK